MDVYKGSNFFWGYCVCFAIANTNFHSHIVDSIDNEQNTLDCMCFYIMRKGLPIMMNRLLPYQKENVLGKWEYIDTQRKAE